MQMHQASFTRSPALRVSLKRGYARQAIDIADRTPPDLSGLFRIATSLRPNAKALERTGRRIKGRPGVVRVCVSPGDKAVKFIARTVQNVESRSDGETIFHETGLIYLRARVALTLGSVGIHLSAVSFCRHALERLIERTDLPLAEGLLPQVDAEAEAIFRGWERGSGFDDAGDAYHMAVAPGVWAGACDEMALSPEWGLVARGASAVPVFSARTFLSEAEMRPTVWLRWKDDPSCTMG